MQYKIALYLVDLLVPIIITISGLLMKYKPPKKMNSFIGYRSSMSRLNMDTWKFAHDLCGRIWIRVGIIMFIFSLIIQIPFLFLNNNIFDAISIILEMSQLIIIIVATLPVEKALNDNFDKNGKRKNKQS